MKISSSEIKVHNAEKVLAEVTQALKAGDFTVDFSGVKSIDSSALALVMGVRRAAGGKPLQLLNLPEQFSSLVAAYGVQSLFA